MAKSLLLLTIIARVFFSITFAFEPLPQQDFCVADLTSSVRINGFPCKDPAKVTVDDFFISSGLHIPGNTSNPYGAALKPVGVTQLPGLNTLGLSIARLDLGANGFIPPHHHHRATELLTVLEGSLEVGFVTSYPGYKLYSKVLEKGDSFVVPVGLLHFQRNAAPGNTVVFAAVNSQNAGINEVTTGIFGAQPAINSDYLAAAFSLDKKIVEELQAKLTR